MPATSSAAGKVSRLNCGLWRERGTVRTSMSRVTEWAASKAINSARGRVEWPTVNMTGWESCVDIVPTNLAAASWRHRRKCVVDDCLRLFHDAAQMILSAKALRIDFVDVLGA